LDMTHQMVSSCATDTANPDMKSTRPMKPAGTSYINEEVKGREGKSERDKRASGSAVPSLDKVHHTYAIPNSTPPPPNPHKCPPPPSMLLEGEESGKQLSRHTDETTTTG
ncbi:hypothetical protein PAXRUDRAFT_166583, partial [Paxillus rubicundulus Ve08.2h10]